jgi:iron uptake system component EfeO
VSRSTPRSQAVRLGALAVTLVLPLAACSGGGEEGDDGAVTVTATEAECTPSATDLDAGVNHFRVTNKGQQSTELYVLRPDGSIVAERENIAPGIVAQVTAELAAGDYTLRCRANDSSDGVTTALKVKGQAAASGDARLTSAMAAYRTYVEKQSEASLALTRQFADAVKAGDVEKAKSLYAPSRVGWESVEPVAESFGDLDPKMDLREADLEAGQTWTGWHVIEKALWAGNTTEGMGPVADQLITDLQELVNRVRKVEITPTSMANGAKELLDEVATGKITGEEEAFSHTDFVDMQANVDGARQVYTLLLPVVKEKDPALVTRIDAGFAKVDAQLAALRTGTGPADFKPYTELTEDGRKTLAADVNALAEPLSGLAGAVVG